MGNKVALYLDHSYQRRMTICHSLELLGLQLRGAQTLEIATEMLKQYYPHMVIIHFDSVGKDIFRFCSFIRYTCAHAIVIVLMEEANVGVEGRLFDCGASDVASGKQTSPRILVKRVRAHLRRGRLLRFQTGRVKLRDAVIDFDRQEVLRDGSVRRLPGILADLLKYFVDNPDHVISRAELLGSPIWADSICTSAEEGGKTFDVNISKLRKIIESDPRRPGIIVSVRGIGWKLATKAVQYIGGSERQDSPDG